MMWIDNAKACRGQIFEKSVTKLNDRNECRLDNRKQLPPPLVLHSFVDRSDTLECLGVGGDIGLRRVIDAVAPLRLTVSFERTDYTTLHIQNAE